MAEITEERLAAMSAVCDEARKWAARLDSRNDKFLKGARKRSELTDRQLQTLKDTLIDSDVDGKLYRAVEAEMKSASGEVQ